MPSGEQFKALVKSHLEGDDQQFYSVALQAAAHEAKMGHGKLAEELRSLIDESKRRRSVGQTVPINRPRGELAGLLEVSYPKARLAEMVLDDNLVQQIQRVIREQRHANLLLEHGLSPRRKLLLVGPPGTGKTMTASVLAGELGIPLFQIRLDGLITKYMGETAAKLRQVFDSTDHSRGVYFFDEFDAIGSQRGLANDVGEIRRVLNSFLQMIEQDRSHSLIVAATNHPEILDSALFRRFDDVFHYELPDEVRIAALMKSRLSRHVDKNVAWRRLAEDAIGLNHAEVTRASDEALKAALIEERRPTEDDLRAMLSERKDVAQRLKKNI
ncbi:MAG TPA: ATP-binding protein [Symbiobacteriaceae bacterium]|nr:ATP-binding protein [Symbiobacteriaceae bacterium]